MEYYKLEAKKKKKTMWVFIQDELSKILARMPITGEEPCNKKTSRKPYSMSLPKETEIVAVKAACLVDLPLSQFITQALRTNHLLAMIESTTTPLIAEPQKLP